VRCVTAAVSGTAARPLHSRERELEMSYITVAVLVLVAGYMLCVARLLAVACAQRLQKPTSPSLSTGLSLAYVLTGDRGDCDYDLLWETQMPALKVLRSGGSGGVPIRRMAKLYREFSRTYPELCDGSSFPAWLDALQNAGVAVYCRYGAMIAISGKGLLVLHDLQESTRLANCPSPR